MKTKYLSEDREYISSLTIEAFLKGCENEISDRLVKALHCASIYDYGEKLVLVGEILDAEPKDMRRFPRFGAATVNELRLVFLSLGIEWGEPIQKPNKQGFTKQFVLEKIASNEKKISTASKANKKWKNILTTCTK